MALLGFGNSDGESDSEETTTDDTTETKMVEETKEAEYTEHKAVVHFKSGGSKAFTFDSMNKDGSAVAFKNYTGAYDTRNPMIGRVQEFESEAFLMIPLDSIKYLETTNRETKTIEYTTTVEKEV